MPELPEVEIVRRQLENHILGATIQHIQIARDELGLETVERPMDRTELFIADELFLVGTGAQISPVSEIDGRIIGDGQIGAVTGALQDLYFDIVRGRQSSYRQWCMSV